MCCKSPSYSHRFQVWNVLFWKAHDHHQVSQGFTLIIRDKKQPSILSPLHFSAVRKVIITWCLSRKSLIIVVSHPSDIIMTLGQLLKVLKRDTRSTEQDNYSDRISECSHASCWLKPCSRNSCGEGHTVIYQHCMRVALIFMPNFTLRFLISSNMNYLCFDVHEVQQSYLSFKFNSDFLPFCLPADCGLTGTECSHPEESGVRRW